MNILQSLNLGFGRRVAMVLQTEASECGLASLAMIAQHYGYGAGLSELRRRFAISLKGATLKDLIRVAIRSALPRGRCGLSSASSRNCGSRACCTGI